MAEAVKVGLIRDGAFFDWLEHEAAALRRFEPDAVEHMIRRAAQLHLDHIATSGDPFETGSARPLDYGHWSAHRLESLSEHALRHGEAVAIGMALDARYAVQEGRLATGVDERICELLEALRLPLWHEALLEEHEGRRAVLDGLEEFRQHLGGRLSITLLEEIGRGVQVDTIDHEGMLAAIEWLRRRAGNR
jgi:3-dehydroquinate synthase